MKSFKKSATRAIKSSMPRFVSIALISFLGAGVFSGLAAVSPNMKRVGDEYFDSENVMDVRMISTYGFTDEDVKAIEKTAGVKDVMATHTIDSIGTVSDKDYVFRINGLDKAVNNDENYINKLKLTSGRLPQCDSEAVIICPSIGLKNIELGSSIYLNTNSNESLKDTLDDKHYTVVGIAQSPYYLSFIQGSTTVGNGSIDYVIYIPDKAFNVDGYTDMYVTIDGAKNYNAFEGEYFDYTNVTVENLDDLADERETYRYNDLSSQLSDAEDEYSTKEQDVNNELNDAKNKLSEGKTNLADAEKEYSDGKTQLGTQKKDADQKFVDAKAKLDSAKKTIASSKTQLASKQKEYQSGKTALSQARTKLDNGWTEYNTSLTTYNSGVKQLESSKSQLDKAQEQFDNSKVAVENSTGMTFEEIKSALPSMEDKVKTSEAQYNSLVNLSQLKATLDSMDPSSDEYQRLNEQYQQALSLAGLTSDKADEMYSQLGSIKTQIDESKAQFNQLNTLISSEVQLEQGWTEYNQGEEKIADSKKALASAKKTLDNNEIEYNKSKATLTSAKTQLDAAQIKITSAEKTYNTGLTEYNSQKSTADKKITDAQNKLASAKTEIADGKKELKTKQQEYDDKSAEATTKLADAKQEIEDSQQKLNDLGEPKWYVLDRNMNEAFATYHDDTQRMHDLATVFPVIFFLVAALVCLTTMTRMVDEDRSLIGTFKALGYSNGEIAGRYLKYAISASLIGSVLGVLVGFKILPSIIWKAYGIVFALPDLTPKFYWSIASIAILSTVFIITLSTGIVAKKSLTETPAELMRPKAPKSGKRVWLEYITPIWNRLTFTQKVTVRNLGLNKKRLVMTLIGIMGCTSLVVTAFGAKNAVSTLVDKQFKTIYHYTVSVGFDGNKPSEQLSSYMNDSVNFNESLQVLNKSAQASLKVDSNDEYSIYVISPKSGDEFKDYISLINPDNKKEFTLGDNDAVISQKLALDLDIDIGDTFKVKYIDKNQYHDVTVTGISTNYAFNYVYFGKDAYATTFGEDVSYNQFLAKPVENLTDDQIKGDLERVEGIGVITFSDDTMGNITTSIKSVNNIIWILIIAAGLLAFVVLYNLTNINIGERQRELATLKVLGFYDKETYNYIFRETIILSIGGCLLGLFSGIYLYRAVVTTVEPDMIFLTRDLTWQGFLCAAILTMLFTIIVNQTLKPRIKNIDMLESLKSVE